MSQYREGSEPVRGYTLVGFLGRGSYGEVWKATGPGGTEVALKFIALDNQQGLKEFRAIGLVKKLRHPNLVPIHAFWLRDAVGNVISDAPASESLETESARFRLGGRKELVIAMGLGDKSLAQRADEAREFGGIPLRELMRYMDGAARGIDFLNEPIHPPSNSPIIHCDIKPGNLLIVGGEVQVCDYGVAQALGADMKKSLGAGTPAYAPPELINNDPCPQSDQYSLAVAYYELRTGKLPFDEKLALQANMTGALDFSGVERDERAVLRRATNLQPERRYATVQDMVDELRVASNVSQSRSGVVSRPVERKAPLAGGATPKRVDPPAKDTVTFPESARPTAPAPKPAAGSETPWADSSQLMPALPPMPAKDEPRAAGRKWVWPLVAGLLLGVGGITAYVVTRPKGDGKVEVNPKVDPPPVVTTPPKTDPPKVDPKKDPPTPTAADVLKTLDVLTLAAPADFPMAAALVDDELKKPRLPAAEMTALAADVAKLVARKLTDAEKPFVWVDSVTVPQLPLGKDKDVGAARKWYAAAAAFAAKYAKPAEARLAELAAFAALVEAVTAEAKPADRLGYYQRAFGGKAGVTAQRLHTFAFQPLAANTLDLDPSRQADAAKFLVSIAVEFQTGTYWNGIPEVLREIAAQFLVKAADADEAAAVAAVLGLPAEVRRALPCADLSLAIGARAETAAKKADAAGLKNGKADAEKAIASFERALAVRGDDDPPAEWHPRLGLLLSNYRVSLPFQNLKSTVTAADARNAAVAFAHYQDGYLLVAEGSKNTTQTAVIGIIRDTRDQTGMYTFLSVRFSEHGKADASPLWPALVAECQYMKSAMAAEDKDKLKPFLRDDPKDDPLLRDCRKRLKRLTEAKKSLADLMTDFGIKR